MATISPAPTISVESPGFRQTPQRTFTYDDYDRLNRQGHQDEEEEEQVETELSEQELRELYDNEEIERYLGLFSAYVTEVQVPSTPPPTSRSVTPNFASAAGSSHVQQNIISSDDEEEWQAAQQETCAGSSEAASNRYTPSKPITHTNLSEEIVNLLIPYLPPPRPPSPPFTYGRLRLALQRLYLVTLPTYLPFIQSMVSLATWEQPMTSSVYCTLFWSLWWYNLLAPAFIARLLFALLQRKLFSYPSLDELRRRRAEVKDADEFGAQVINRLSSSSSNMTEMWRLMRMLDRTRKMRMKKLKEKARATQESKDRRTSNEGCREQEDATSLDNGDESEEVRDLQRLGLILLDRVADLHERAQNIFIWRKSSASQRYAIALFGLFLVSFFPAQYLTKMVLFVLGFLFWHATPLFSALSEQDSRRIPPAFADVPTDAEYAMQLISERVEKGLDLTIKPTKRHKKNKESTDSLPSGARSSRSSSTASLVSQEPKKKSLFNRTSNSIGDLMKLAPGSGWPITESWPPQHPLIPLALGIAQPDVNVGSHTYPCQHTSSPGLITLTPRAFFFTPLMSQNAKAVIPLSAVKGVKKTGLLKGLNIRWSDPADPNKAIREDKFHWIAARDELFARLVGTEGLKWHNIG